MWKVVPGQIVSVRPNKRWTHRRYHYMSGQIEGTRIDIPAIGLKPPALHERGSTDIGEPYAANLEALWRIVAANRNVDYELERIIPGADERGADDPVLEALELRDVGDNDGAEKALMDLLQADLRCLEAHALLGAWTFETKYDSLAAKALLHFEVGVAIGEQAVGPDFDGRLPWTYVGNRPFLRCLHGFGLALWRQGRTDDAIKAFERVSTLNPNDELEARLCWRATLDGTPWSEWSS
jgi:tetratricopeptide (TPR) repeat protein